MEKEVGLSEQGPLPVLSPSAHGPTGNPCLDAFAVVLNNTCDGKPWFASTQELQLVSLQLCGACRAFNNVHLEANPQIPRTLLAAADAPAAHPTGLCSTRVPRLGVVSVAWNMSTATELKSPISAFAGVRYLTFGGNFDGALEGVVWPQRLKALTFSKSRFKTPLEHVQWPASLEDLDFGLGFNLPVERVVWPASLRLLDFGEQFNQPVQGIVWPGQLVVLRFGPRFNQ
ncbi:unnamed protein product, partial [Ectocarpus sp. 12 AP-2014]